MRLDTVWAVARAEARITRRLARFWIFYLLACALALVFLAFFITLHRGASGYTATAAQMNPRYLIGAVGGWFLIGVSLVLIFLGIEVRARDQRERVVEPLDARPISNLELLFGRALGIFVPCYIGLVVTMLLLVSISAFFATAPEPYSLFTFFTLLGAPFFVMMIGLTFLASLLTRSRAIGAILMVAPMLTLMALYLGWIPVPWYMFAIFDGPGVFGIGFPSDVAPSIMPLANFLQRCGAILVGVGALVLAAAWHPRRDGGSIGRRALIGGLTLVAGAVMFSAPVISNKRLLHQLDAWRAEHQKHVGEPLPDLLALTAQAKVEPGKALSIDVALRFAAPAAAPLRQALFTLNPGYSVDKVTAEQGAALPYRFEQGLLSIELPQPLAPGQELTLRLTASGKPDNNFGYLDAVKHPLRGTSRDGQIYLLGFNTLLFDRRFVGLLPGAAWLPLSGHAIGFDDATQRPRDLFTVDLTADLPADWLAAGPGRRDSIAGATSGQQRFHWSPGAPVDGVGLIASRYESASAAIDGRQFEMLLIPAHKGVFATLAPAKQAFLDLISEKLKDAKGMGIDYPYSGLTLVEVPGALRGYGGGWQMPSTLGPAGVVMVRESGFPTARFDTVIESASGAGEDKKKGQAEILKTVVYRFFENDFSGGNPFDAIARQSVVKQVAPTGADGDALDAFLDRLGTQLLTRNPGFFSVHVFDSKMGEVIGRSFGTFFSGQATSVGEAVLKAATSRNTVWDQLTTKALTKLRPGDDPRLATDLLTLKSSGMARSLVDDIGRSKSAAWLAQLLSAKRGQTVTRADLVAAATAAEVPQVAAQLGVWVDGSGLPGFVAGDVSATRLTDGEGGVLRYQVRLVLRNEEPVSGVAAAVCVAREAKSETTPQPQGPFGGNADLKLNDPIVVRVDGKSAVTIGCVTSSPPVEVRIVPYLALNRDRFSVAVPKVDDTKQVAAEPFQGVEPTAFVPVSPDVVVVDDLDPGFAIEGEAKKGFRLAGKVDPEQTDAGLPTRQGPRATTTWSREVSLGAYGHYRHTDVIVAPGKGETRAVFTANLPRAGAWQLWIYKGSPPGVFPPAKFGKWSLTVETGGNKRDVSFGADAAESGWNSLGTFDLAAGPVRVALSDKAEGNILVADAIRLTIGP